MSEFLELSESKPVLVTLTSPMIVGVVYVGYGVKYRSIGGECRNFWNCWDLSRFLVAPTSRRMVVSFMSAIESNIVVLETNVGISGIVGI